MCLFQELDARQEESDALSTRKEVFEAVSPYPRCLLASVLILAPWSIVTACVKAVSN